MLALYYDEPLDPASLEGRVTLERSAGGAVPGQLRHYGMAIMLAYGAYLPGGVSLLRSGLVVSGSIIAASVLAALVEG